MLKVKDDVVKVKGSEWEILSEITILFISLAEEGFTKEDLLEAVENAFLPEEELEKKMIDLLDDCKKEFLNGLKTERETEQKSCDNCRKSSKDHYGKAFVRHGR